MILGVDWLISLGPLKVDWGKGSLMRGTYTVKNILHT